MKKILNLYLFYNIYQALIGCNKWHKRYYENFIRPIIENKSIISILDIGCGTGNLVKNLPHTSTQKKIYYTGIDYQQNYISYCIKKYPEHKFFCQSALDYIDLKTTFDIIISEALISNFDNENAEKFFENIIRHSNENTTIIISDMNYKKENSKIENLFLSNERGSVLRGKKEYIEILSKYFNIKSVFEINNAYRIPYQKIVFVLEKL